MENIMTEGPRTVVVAVRVDDADLLFLADYLTEAVLRLAALSRLHDAELVRLDNPGSSKEQVLKAWRVANQLLAAATASVGRSQRAIVERIGQLSGQCQTET